MNRYWAVALMLASATAHADTMYRSVAEDGTVSYSDRPTGANAEVIDIGDIESSLRQARPETDEAQQPPAAATLADTDELPIEELRARKEQNCTDSQTQLAHILSTDQLYRQTPTSGMQLLNDEEVTEARGRAQAEVDAWCS